MTTSSMTSLDNSSKPCSVCREVKTAAEYSKNKLKTDGLQSSCKKCSAAGSARWYKENPQTRVVQNRYQRNRNKAFVDRYKRIHGKCTDCGITDPRVLQFDHLGDKHKNVSDMIYQGNSIKLIKNEIRKCEMRCANCHSIITQQRKDSLEPI
jgi:hypothetical protein